MDLQSKLGLWFAATNDTLIKAAWTAVAVSLGTGPLWAVKPIRDWLLADTSVNHGTVLILGLLLITYLGTLVRVAVARREARTRRSRSDDAYYAQGAYPHEDPYLAHSPEQRRMPRRAPAPGLLSRLRPWPMKSARTPAPNSRSAGQRVLPPPTGAAVHWTPLLEAALAVLLARAGEVMSLEGLFLEVKRLRTTPTVKLELAQQMIGAERARIVRIARASRNLACYSLTPQGREWAVGRVAMDTLRRAMASRGATVPGRIL